MNVIVHAVMKLEMGKLVVFVSTKTLVTKHSAVF